jgi:hypothetical protein
MTDREAAECVMRWAIQAYTESVGRLVEAGAKAAGNLAFSQSWEKDPLYACSGPNPYTKDYERFAKQEQRALQEQIDRKRVRDFVINRICNLVETS